ncbi:MAG TPA: alpha/beta fold hydrolase [Azospirillaceae bacterium]|nr:alpha/beta fold hydrolase [Azospirillaceae bacterium]
MTLAVSDFPAFRPAWPWIGGDLQTVRATVREALRRPGPRIAGPPEHLRFPMGDGDVLLGALNRPQPDADARGRPLAVLLHGLTGCQDGAYMHATGAALLARGYAVLRLNLRGAGPSRPLCRASYHAGRTADLRAVLAQLPSELTGHGLVLVGYSLGGNILLKFLGEAPVEAPVRAAVSVSAPIDLGVTSRRFLALRNRLYHRWLLRRMKSDALATPGIDAGTAALVAGLRTTWAFDDAYVAPGNGFRNAADYYAHSSARSYLHGIGVPTLVIHALDDPWIPGEVYSSFDWGRNPSLVPLLPRIGGHVGFHAKGGAWHDVALLRFLDATVGAA